MSRRRKRRWLIVVVLLLLVAGGGGYYYYSKVYLPSQTSAGPSYQTTRVRQGDLIISATGAGSVIPASERAIGFRSSGLLTELAVSVGDRVEAGKVLARIDDLQARQAMSSAESQLAKAEQDLESARNAYDDLLDPPSEADLLEAQAALANAEEQMANLESGATAADIAQAEAALTTARENYQLALARPDETEIRKAELSLDQAKNSLWSSQMNRDATCGTRPDSSTCDGAEVSVLNGEISVQRAEMDLTAAKEGPTQAELQDLAAKVVQAEENLAELRASATEASLATARAQVARAKQNLEELTAGASDEEIAASLAAIKEAELSVANAKLSLEAAREDLAGTNLVAPMDGVVMEITAEVGESVGGDFLTLVQVDHPLIEIYLDESDLDMIAVGYEVEVVLDAMPDDTFTGHVVYIHPALVTVSNVNAVRALVELDASSFAKPGGLMMGLSATVEVIGGRAEGVLLVPVEALRELGPDEYAVFVVEDGELKFREVEVGLMDFSFAEIRSGLTSEETVSTGIVETLR